MNKLNQRYIVYGSSVIGSGHKKKLLPNQDSFLTEIRHDFVSVIVSDGVGSKPYSDIGSYWACKCLNKVFHEFQNDNKTASLSSLLKYHKSLWEYKISPYLPNDCAATLLFAVILGKQLFLGRLGDGMICLKQKRGFTILTDSKDTSFSNITSCLNNKTKYSDWELFVCETKELEFVLLATDGVADDIESNEMKKSFAVEFNNTIVNTKNCSRTKKINSILNDWPPNFNGDDKTIAAISLKRL